MSGVVDDAAMQMATPYPFERGDTGLFSTRGAIARLRAKHERGLEGGDIGEEGLAVGDDFSVPADSMIEQAQYSLWPTYPLFFLIGLALPISYSSITFKTEFFVECLDYGQAFVRTCFAAYNMPALPIFYAQYRLDRKYDLRFGTSAATFFRVFVCALMMLVPLAVLPFSNPSFLLLAVTLAVGGIANGAMFSSMCTLASCFGYKPQAFLLTGAGSATFILLALNVSLKENICDDSNHVSNSHRLIFFGVPAILTVMAIVWVAILLRLPVGRHFTSIRDEDLQAEQKMQKQAEATALTAPKKAPSGAGSINGGSEEPLLDPLAVEKALAPGAKSDEDVDSHGIGAIAWKARWPLILATVSYLPTYITYPLFPAFSGIPEFIKQNIFYLDAAGAFLGRQGTLILPKVESAMKCAIFALIRSVVGATFLFLFAGDGIKSPSLGLFLPIFGLWGLTHGYLGTLPYRLADQCFTSAADKKQVGVLLQVIITLCVYVTSVFNFFILPIAIPKLA